MFEGAPSSVGELSDMRLRESEPAGVLLGVETMAVPLAAVEVVVPAADVDADRWTAFYRAEYPRLVQALTLYTGDRELGAELAQEAMARAWRHWSRIKHYEAPAGWVHRVGINRANSALGRRNERHESPLDARAERTAAPTVDTGTAMAVRAAVARLPRRQRTALVLRYFVDLPIEEVARSMRCRPGTVTALTAQAMANLRAAGLQETEEELR